jgi:hypothetical protein
MADFGKPSPSIPLIRGISAGEIFLAIARQLLL